MKQLKKILYYLAATILMLHSLVAHSHHQATEITSYDTQSNEIRWLISSFISIDLGDGHLEHINIDEGDFDLFFDVLIELNKLPTPSLIILQFKNRFTLVKFISSIINPDNEKVHNTTIDNKKSLRGPPKGI